jgi:hypothetical protein
MESVESCSASGPEVALRLAKSQTIRLNRSPVKIPHLDNPMFVMAFLGAAHQTLRSVARSMVGRASGGFHRRVALVLVGVALLGAASAVREFDIGIRDRRVEGGASTIRVKRGDTVLLRWRTDEAVSLHVHGYDLRANLTVASPATMRFEAAVAGRFPITAHEFGAASGSDAHPKKQREPTLLYLEVLPE